MRKMFIGMTTAAVLTFSGILAWNAEATSLPGNPGVNYSLVEKAACGGRLGRCPTGQHWICASPHNCACIPCNKALICKPPRHLVNINGTWYCR